MLSLGRHSLDFFRSAQHTHPVIGFQKTIQGGTRLLQTVKGKPAVLLGGQPDFIKNLGPAPELQHTFHYKNRLTGFDVEQLSNAGVGAHALKR